MGNSKRILSLESIRFYMVLLVVFSHFSFLGDAPIYKYIFGYPGMAINYFFILSGFGLSLSFLNKKSFCMESRYSLVKGFKYAFSKVKKIYPLYLITMVLCMPVYFKWNSSNRLLKVMIMPTLLQSAFGTTDISQAFNGVCWFLSTLFIFYVFYPLLEKIFYRIIKNKRCAILCVIVDGLLISPVHSFLTSMDQLIGRTFFTSYASPLWWIIFFIIGIHLGYLHKFAQDNSIIIRYPDFIEITLISITILWYLLYGYLNLYLLTGTKIISILNKLTFLLPMFLVYFFSFEKGCISKFLNKKICVTLGSVSMYIFLIHSTIRLYLVYIPDFGNAAINNLISIFCMVGLTGVATYATHILYKKAGSNKLNRLFKGSL